MLALVLLVGGRSRRGFLGFLVAAGVEVEGMGEMQVGRWYIVRVEVQMDRASFGCCLDGTQCLLGAVVEVVDGEAVVG